MQNSDRPYRYELKYCLSPRDIEKFLSILYCHPSGFSNQFPDRVINNIYYDDISFNSCHENLFGISDRVKIRYRWYGDIKHFSEGVLEKKIKTNALGSKAYFKLDGPQDLNSLTEQVNRLMRQSGKLFPSLQNAYTRSYFVDQSGVFRLTVDRDLSYNFPSRLLHNMQEASYHDERCIIEIKFDVEHFEKFNSISSAFPFRVVKHSKYVSGLLALVY